jgi:hypothetical protein
MKKQPLSYYDNAHYGRRQMIHGWIILIAFSAALFMFFTSCSPRNGCRATRGMGGYGYCPTLKELRKDKRIAYLYCLNTGVVGVWDIKGRLSCTYHVPSK